MKYAYAGFRRGNCPNYANQQLELTLANRLSRNATIESANVINMNGNDGSLPLLLCPDSLLGRLTVAFQPSLHFRDFPRLCGNRHLCHVAGLLVCRLIKRHA